MLYCAGCIRRAGPAINTSQSDHDEEPYGDEGYYECDGSSSVDGGTSLPSLGRRRLLQSSAFHVTLTSEFQPVCNEEGNVVGLLDITKVFHEALDKVERSSSASEKLYSALAGVQTELGPGMSTNPQAAAMLAYVDALREKTALPDLTTVMDSRTHPATVTPKTTVKEAAKLMKEHRTTAVCVMENLGQSTPPRIAGIFTSKDVVLRVIAAGLEPSRCSVVRVMTPHPDVAQPTMTVQDALKKMHSKSSICCLLTTWVLKFFEMIRWPLLEPSGGRNGWPIGRHCRRSQAYLCHPRAGE